jgi:hypothetical protein
MKHYKGKFHIEQDSGYVEEQCPVTKIWSMTKRVSLKTWTLYERVGSPSYQTPRQTFKNENEAQKHLDSLPE